MFFPPQYEFSLIFSKSTRKYEGNSLSSRQHHCLSSVTETLSCIHCTRMQKSSFNCINQHVQGGGQGSKTLPCGLLHLGLISAVNKYIIKIQRRGIKQPVRTQSFLRCAQLSKARHGEIAAFCTQSPGALFSQALLGLSNDTKVFLCVEQCMLQRTWSTPRRKLHSLGVLLPRIGKNVMRAMIFV